MTAGQHRRTAGESCGFEVDGGRRGGSEATTAEDAGFRGGEAAANSKTEPWGGAGVGHRVTEKKCDTLFGVGVEGAMRQFGLPARRRKQTAFSHF